MVDSGNNDLIELIHTELCDMGESVEEIISLISLHTHGFDTQGIQCLVPENLILNDKVRVGWFPVCFVRVGLDLATVTTCVEADNHVRR